MEIRITLIALLTLTLSATAQKRISYSYAEIKKAQYDSCSKAQFLVTNDQIKKQAGKLTIPISANPAKIFKDDNSDKNFHEFEYLGNIRGTKLSLIKRTDYNSEEFYLINQTTGNIDTLIGLPVFAQNMRDFACINNPGTDEKQHIQVCEIRSGLVNTRVYLKGKAGTLLEDITCVRRNSILTKDNEGRFWKLNFKLGDE